MGSSPTNAEPITIRSALTHSSGLPRESDYPYWTDPAFPFPTAEKFKNKLSEQRTLYPASTFFQYSNLGMALLGLAIWGKMRREEHHLHTRFEDYSDYVKRTHRLIPKIY